MPIHAAVVVEPKASRASRVAVRRAASYLRGLGYQTANVQPDEARGGAMHANLRADVVLLSTGSGKTSALVALVHQAFPHARLLVATDAQNPRTVSKAYSAGAAVVAPPNAFVQAVRNVIYVTARDAATSTDSTQVRVAAGTSRHPIEDLVVGEFHDPETGRLDATRISKDYGISLSALAGALGVTQSALSKRTTALAAQPGLRDLEFAWATLRDAVGSPERIRAWLNARRPDLDGKPPIRLLLEGSAGAFANYVRSVVAGEPG